MEEWEQTAKQLKSNAEFLESLCQDKLTLLYHDKRKARKTYQEEHQKISAQFTNVSIVSINRLEKIEVMAFFHRRTINYNLYNRNIDTNLPKGQISS